MAIGPPAGRGSFLPVLRSRSGCGLGTKYGLMCLVRIMLSTSRVTVMD